MTRTKSSLICQKCGRTLPREAFDDSPRARYYKHSRCRECVSASVYAHSLESKYIVDLDTGCWIWQKHTNNAGYGHVTRNGRVCDVHRLMYEQTFGPIPIKHDIHHVCGNKRCVNPHHLVAVDRRTHMLEDGRLYSFQIHHHRKS